MMAKLAQRPDILKALEGVNKVTVFYAISSERLAAIVYFRFGKAKSAKISSEKSIFLYFRQSSANLATSSFSHMRPVGFNGLHKTIILLFSYFNLSSKSSKFISNLLFLINKLHPTAFRFCNIIYLDNI